MQILQSRTKFVKLPNHPHLLFYIVVLKIENHIAQFELSFEAYTLSSSKVLLVTFYYQGMASAKDKTTQTTAATEVQEVAQVREVVK